MRIGSHRKRIFVFSALALAFLYSFLIYDINYHGPDEPVYYSYIASIVEDGDLNIANQMYAKGDRFFVSSTYNVPDFHNHGAVVLRAPFYLYAKAARAIFARLNFSWLPVISLERATKCCLSFSTVFFGFLALLLTYLLCRVFFPPARSFWSTLTITLGTPFFYFLLIETGNANIIAVLFSACAIWGCLSLEGKDRREWFFYGLFFSLCPVMKTEFWFQLAYMVPFFALCVARKRASWVHLLYFAAGVIPLQCFVVANKYLMYGTLRAEAIHLFSLKNFYFFEQLFSPYRGYFYTSPVLYVSLAGFLWLLADARKRANIGGETELKRHFFLLLAVYVFIKIFVISFRYAWGGGTPGTRHLLTEFPVFVLFFAQAFEGRGKLFRVTLAVFAAVTVAWNWLILSEYLTGNDIKYLFEFPAITARGEAFEKLFFLLSSIRDIRERLAYGLPLLCAAAAGVPFLFAFTRDRKSFLSVLRLPAFVVTLLYVLLTLFNFYYNGRNTQRLKDEGFFERAELLTSSEFERQENLCSIDEMIAYFSAKGDTERVAALKKLREELYNK